MRTLWGLPDLEFKSEEPTCRMCRYYMYLEDVEFEVCTIANVRLRYTDKRYKHCPLRKVEKTLDNVKQNRRGQFVGVKDKVEEGVRMKYKCRECDGIHDYEIAAIECCNYSFKTIRHRCSKCDKIYAEILEANECCVDRKIEEGF